MRSRLMEVMQKVEMANEYVQRAISTDRTTPTREIVVNKERRLSGAEGKLEPIVESNNNSKSPVPAPGKSTRPTANQAEAKRSLLQEKEIQEVQGLDNHPALGAGHLVTEGDDDLEDTLASWLLQQKRAVITRKKPAGSTNSSVKSKGYAAEDSKEAEVVAEEDGIYMYRSMYDNRKKGGGGGGAAVASSYEDDIEVADYNGGFDSNDSNEVEEDLVSPSYRDPAIDNNNTPSRTGASTFDIHRPLKGKFLGGDDVEVVGMQCMLAKALMGDDDDDL